MLLCKLQQVAVLMWFVRLHQILPANLPCAYGSFHALGFISYDGGIIQDMITGRVINTDGNLGWCQVVGKALRK